MSASFLKSTLVLPLLLMAACASESQLPRTAATSQVLVCHGTIRTSSYMMPDLVRQAGFRVMQDDLRIGAGSAPRPPSLAAPGDGGAKTPVDTAAPFCTAPAEAPDRCKVSWNGTTIHVDAWHQLTSMSFDLDTRTGAIEIDRGGMDWQSELKGTCR